MRKQTPTQFSALVILVVLTLGSHAITATAQSATPAAPATAGRTRLANSGDVVSLANVIVAAMAALVSAGFALQAQRTAARALHIDEQTFVTDYIRDLRTWAEQVINTFSEAIMLTDPQSSIGGGPDGGALRERCRQQLSSLADAGRFYFPNRDRDTYGIDKESAYRGIRHKALDAVLIAHDQVGAPTASSCWEITRAKRRFVSITQQALDPRVAAAELKRRGLLLDTIARIQSTTAAKDTDEAQDPGA